jgi:hypothetical protein
MEKDKQLKKFISLVIKNAPEYDNFSIHELHKALELTEYEKKQYINLTFEIRKHLVDNDLATMYGSRKVILTEKGRELKNGTYKKSHISINNDFRKSNIGSVIQDSRLKKAAIKNKVIAAPTSKPVKKSLLKKIYSDPWVIGIILLVIAAFLNSDRIKNWIDSIIENF